MIILVCSYLEAINVDPAGQRRLKVNPASQQPGMEDSHPAWGRWHGYEDPFPSLSGRACSAPKLRLDKNPSISHPLVV